MPTLTTVLQTLTNSHAFLGSYYMGEQYLKWSISFPMDTVVDSAAPDHPCTMLAIGKVSSTLSNLGILGDYPTSSSVLAKAALRLVLVSPDHPLLSTYWNRTLNVLMELESDMLVFPLDPDPHLPLVPGFMTFESPIFVNTNTESNEFGVPDTQSPSQEADCPPEVLKHHMTWAECDIRGPDEEQIPRQRVEDMLAGKTVAVEFKLGHFKAHSREIFVPLMEKITIVDVA